MNPLHLKRITNHFQDVQLASLATWSKSEEISPRDRGGPCVVLQEAYNPEDPRMRADEFVLGRSGQWISLSYVYRLPVPDRREEDVFGTAPEIMEVMGKLPAKVVILRPSESPAESLDATKDEMATAIEAGKERSGDKPIGA